MFLPRFDASNISVTREHTQWRAQMYMTLFDSWRHLCVYTLIRNSYRPIETRVTASIVWNHFQLRIAIYLILIVTSANKILRLSNQIARGLEQTEFKRSIDWFLVFGKQTKNRAGFCLNQSNCYLSVHLLVRFCWVHMRVEVKQKSRLFFLDPTHFSKHNTWKTAKA